MCDYHFSKEEALRCLKGVNDYYGFRDSVVAKDIANAVNKIGRLSFKTIIRKESVKSLFSDERVLNILWLNSMLNCNEKEFDLYQTFNYFGTNRGYRHIMPSSVRQRLNDKLRRSDLLLLYVFTHTPELKNSSSITLRAKGCGKIELKDWFTDMLRKYSEEHLTDITSIDQAREALVKPKGRPSTLSVNCVIWGTYKLFSDFDVIKRGVVSKDFLIHLCDYLDFLGYPSDEEDLNKRCDNIRSTISQMRSGKMKRPHFKQIGL